MVSVRAELTRRAVLEAVSAAGEGPLDVLDLAGGTGGDAVRLAQAGHRVTVVDQSPDALASLARRSRDADVEIRGVLADVTESTDIGEFDLVLVHGILEHLADPLAALIRVRGVLRRDRVRPALASVIVPGRVAAATSRAMAGDFGAATAIVATPWESWDTKELGPRRFHVHELVELVERSGLSVVETSGLGAFADFVPDGIVDSSAAARDGLVALECEARRHSQFVEHSSGLRSLARLD